MAEDKGPGIPDIDLAMQEGYSTAPEIARELGFGAGMGLPNIKRCADRLNIQSEVGEGTLLEIYFDIKAR
jgi:anti-sigma regulatory factor (Ser/Thr protein kinase)